MDKIVIVGAGLVGSLQAIFMAKRGYEVHIYERRSDMRKADLVAGRSINLALSDRGWKALKIAGIEDKILKMAIPMKGRMMHSVEGELTFQPYGKENQAIYSVSRGGLNIELMNAAEELDNVHFHFDQRCLDVNLEANEIEFENGQNGQLSKVKADRIIGTDGAFSAIRARLQKTDRFNYSQFYLEHGYKELVIPANADGSHKLDKNALHIWPRGEYMMIALANLDGSFTCTLFFPFEGKPSFNAIKTESDVRSFFKEVFPDALEMMPTLIEDYFSNPTASLVTVRCEPWNYGDGVMLMGDASHAIVPFYGQGMNSGFEDCSVFHEIMNETDGDWAMAMDRFSKERKKDADAISNLALSNFIEMRDLVADDDFLLRKKIEKKLFETHPDKWMPLYSQVTFSHIPYSEALEAGERQRNIMDEVMAQKDIHQKWDSTEVMNKILEKLA